jgi:hypothetical protein
LSAATVARGLIVGTALMVGSWISKRILQDLDAGRFAVLIEAMMRRPGYGCFVDLPLVSRSRSSRHSRGYRTSPRDR